MPRPAIAPMNDALYSELRAGCCPLPPDDDGGLGAGQLTAAGGEVVLPLRATDVSASVAGPCASVQVTQTFANDRDVPLECVYVFPLPPEAAVTELVFVVGERRLHAELQERGKAERAYEAAREAGQRASLLTAERADVFTMNVANIQPGEEVRVELTYAQVLSFDDGGFVFRFPLVLGDRYVPGAPTTEHGEATDQVPDADRIKPPRLLPGVRPAHDLSLSVVLDVGALGLRDVACSQHATSTSFEDGRVTVALARADELPNRDFILRWRVGGDGVQGAIWRAGDGDRFAAICVPPADLPADEAVAREVVLVVDTSSSMHGPKMPAAIEAARLVLRGLREGDALQVCEFNSRHRKLWRQPKAAVDKTIAEADTFLSRLIATGGTEIMAPLQDVLRKPPASGRVRHLVLITDGQVGNEADIVRWVGGRDQALRTFAVGIDTAVNEAFLKQLASATRGLATFMTPSDPIAERMTRFLATVGEPVLTGAAIDGVEPVAPIPDLYLGRPVVVCGTFDGPTDAVTLRATGSDGVGRAIDLGAPRDGGDAVARAVGKAVVDDLQGRYSLHRRDEDKAALLAASLEEGILCTLTGFVVVDPTETGGGEGQTMHVPAMPPADWAMYDTGAWGATGGMAPPSPMRPSPVLVPAPLPGSVPSVRSRRMVAKKSAPPRAQSIVSKTLGSLLDAVRGGGGDDFEDFQDVDLEAGDDAFALAEEAPADEAVMQAEVRREAPEPAAEPEPEPAPAPTLAALALRQRLDGSFPPIAGESVLQATADALTRLLEAGNTDARGTYRQAVAKAVAYLLAALPGIPAAHADRVAVMDALKRWVDEAGTTSARERLASAAAGR